MLWTSQPTSVRGSNASKQVVFSGTGLGDFSNTPTPFGFWIWCEGESGNPYVGKCSRAMYFYALGITKHVAGMVVEPAEDTYQMTVASTADSSIESCVLTNVPPITSGPTNAVNVSCGTPSGSGQSATAVVKVTGP